MKNKKKEAVAALLAQRDIIKANPVALNYPWATHTVSIVEFCFGPDSYESKHARTAGISGYDIESDWVEFLDNCVEAIRIKGLYKRDRVNFVYRIPNSWLGVVLPLVLSSVGYVGYMVGVNTTDAKLIRYEMRLEEMKDSLVFFRLNGPADDHAEPVK